MLSSGCRVVILTYDRSGGMLHYARSLAEALKANCIAHVHVVAPDEGLPAWPRWARGASGLRLVGKLRAYYNPWRARRIAGALVRKYAPALVHLNGAIPCLHTTVSEFHRLGVAVAYTVHDPLPHVERRTIWGHLNTWLVQHWLLPRSLGRVDLLHVHSAAHAAQLLRRYPRLDPSRIRVVQHGGGVPPGLEIGRQLPAEMGAAAVQAGYVLFFGRIEPYKGLAQLFAAIARLAPGNPALRLVVAGGGRLPLIPDELRDRIVLINRFIADAEISSIFKGACCVVLPYLEATQTGVIPLASAFGVPAVVSRVGALPELVVDGETGLLVEAGDVEALASAIGCLVAAPEQAAAMGRAACAHMQQHFSWEAVARAHHGHYLAHLGKLGVST